MSVLADQKVKEDVWLHTYDRDHLIPLNGKIPEVNVVICDPAFNFQISMNGNAPQSIQ